VLVRNRADEHHDRGHTAQENQAIRWSGRQSPEPDGRGDDSNHSPKHEGNQSSRGVHGVGARFEIRMAKIVQNALERLTVRRGGIGEFAGPGLVAGAERPGGEDGIHQCLVTANHAVEAEDKSGHDAKEYDQSHEETEAQPPTGQRRFEETPNTMTIRTEAHHNREEQKHQRNHFQCHSGRQPDPRRNRTALHTRGEHHCQKQHHQQIDLPAGQCEPHAAEANEHRNRPRVPPFPRTKLQFRRRWFHKSMHCNRQEPDTQHVPDSDRYRERQITGPVVPAVRIGEGGENNGKRHRVTVVPSVVIAGGLGVDVLTGAHRVSGPGVDAEVGFAILLQRRANDDDRAEGHEHQSEERKGNLLPAEESIRSGIIGVVHPCTLDRRSVERADGTQKAK